MMRLVTVRRSASRARALTMQCWSIPGLMLLLAATAASAAASEVRIGSGTGIHYLPLYVMDSYHLLEKHAAALGAPVPKATYTKLSGGASLNEAVISGAVDIAAAGVGPFAILWDKTKGRLNVKALAASGDVPLVLVTTESRIKNLNDIQEDDRIAVPAVKSSMQAVVLQMGVARAKGAANYEALDQNTVSMPHSEAVLALLSRRGLVNLHFSVPPFSNRELADPTVRRVTDSTEIMGGPMSLNLIFATERFHDADPVVCRAFQEGLAEAMDIINSDRSSAVRIYLDNDSSGGTETSFIAHVLDDPALVFTVVPHGVLGAVGFMHKIGIIKNDPESLKDMFFSDAPILEGN